MLASRLVWSRIWAVLSDFFVEVGCHANLQVAMYGIDSMRQLAMKFLERDELANFTFQNDFLRPFVVVMRQSRAVEIRELIIRCATTSLRYTVGNSNVGGLKKEIGVQGYRWPFLALPAPAKVCSLKKAGIDHLSLMV